MSSAMGELTGQMKEVTAHIQAQTSHATAKIRQQLEQDIEVAASSATTTSENINGAAVEEVRHVVQAQFEQTCADAQWRQAETRSQVDKIAANLLTLME